MNRPIAAICFAVALAASVAGALLHASYPLSDNAMFEYGGRAIVRGEQLYRDVLPTFRARSPRSIIVCRRWASSSIFSRD